jgi:hypothetical protein
MQPAEAPCGLRVESYLDGFSSNVQEILDNLEFRNQLFSKADALGTLIEKLVDPPPSLRPRSLAREPAKTGRFAGKFTYYTLSSVELARPGDTQQQAESAPRSSRWRQRGQAIRGV